MHHKVLLLYSGGLDSLLAARILMQQDIEVIGLHCILPSVDPEIVPENLYPSKLAESIHLPLVYYRCDEDYLAIVANPKLGYGKNANPCIDCKIFFLTKAKEYMQKLGVSFIATGEVVGQRPMSQYKSMLRHIEKEAGLEGLLVRPLSAKLLPPTIPEQQGIIDREKLYAISGRSRHQQIKLAQVFGITQFQTPAGGCFLTIPQLSVRVKDMLTHPPYLARDLFLINVGRHYRLHANAKIIVARNQKECNILKRYQHEADLYLEPLFKGPSVLGIGIFNENDYMLCAAIVARYGRYTQEESRIAFYQKGYFVYHLIAKHPIDADTLTHMRI